LLYRNQALAIMLSGAKTMENWTDISLAFWQN